ncbi:hypothetical protein [Sinomonas terrae]|uniref:Helix-turn-helix domain-containing protein n=1 Tax=Sinomonas terrae TaxID=2908838 RepID=A0ABS9U3U4_9MICC|nr:hypothetical protein [Sinomonas terrae]MCH6471182.1 hypothetical protein [Sinomonas terrae]
MQIVGVDADAVERRLRGGRMACGCGGSLGPWGSARRRVVRGLGASRPRRSRCRGCGRTHVLLPATALSRRADAARVIGSALVAKARGAGHRRIAAEIGVPEGTVRGWMRAFGRNAEAVRVFTALLGQLDPLAGPMPPSHGGGFADALEAIGRAGSAARRRLGAGVAVSSWTLASVVTGGLLLSPAFPGPRRNTSCP